MVTGRHPENEKPLSKLAHVPDALGIWHNLKSAVGQWGERIEPLYDSYGRGNWIEHPLGRAVDVVALPLTQTVGIEIYPYSLAPHQVDVAVGPSELVSIVGFPFGRTVAGCAAIWVQGTVASEPDLDFDGKPCWLVDSRTREGQSGSPVIVYRAGGPIRLKSGTTLGTTDIIENFLGVYSGRISDQSDLGMVWKTRALEELLASAKRTTRCWGY